MTYQMLQGSDHKSYNDTHPYSPCRKIWQCADSRCHTQDRWHRISAWLQYEPWPAVLPVDSAVMMPRYGAIPIPIPTATITIPTMITTRSIVSHVGMRWFMVRSLCEEYCSGKVASSC